MKKKKQLIHPYSYVGTKYGEVMEKLKEKNMIQHQSSKRPNPKILKDVILKIISDECDIKMEDIVSPSRLTPVVDARYIYVAALKIKFNMGLTEIGKNIDGRDHTTIIHALKTFDSRYENETAFKEKVDRAFYMLNIKYVNKFYPKKA